MTPSPLAAHLGIVIVVKLLLLGCLWLVFVRGDSLAVDPDAMAARAGVSASHVRLLPGEDHE